MAAFDRIRSGIPEMDIALDYRKRRGLADRDEQMALLIQRVSGSYYGLYYMPCAAGVGYSYSPYRIMKNTDPTAGMLRLVMGLGTSAVDRTEGSYPRIVNLDMPEKTSYSSSADKHKFSQGKAEVINMTERKLEKLTYEKMEQDIPKYLEKILLEHDTEAESRLREMGRRREVKFISCIGLVSNVPLMDQMRRMLESIGASMGISKASSLDLIVYVDPIKYYELPYKEKDLVAKLIGKINWHYRDTDKHMMLIVPGRVGTTSPELGVPTSFADISAYDIICETEETRAGYNPELSYGSHIFQDLVEAEILYTAIFQGEKTKHYFPQKLEDTKDVIDEFDYSDALEGVVHVYDLSDRKCEVYNDVAKEHLLITYSNIESE